MLSLIVYPNKLIWIISRYMNFNQCNIVVMPPNLCDALFVARNSYTFVLCVCAVCYSMDSNILWADFWHAFDPKNGGEFKKEMEYCDMCAYALNFDTVRFCSVEMCVLSNDKIRNVFAYCISKLNGKIIQWLQYFFRQVQWEYPKSILFNCFIENFSYDFIAKPYPIHIYHLVISISISISNFENNFINIFVLFKPHEVSTSNLNFCFQHHFRKIFKHI